jgi:hypothetical protein
LPDPNLLGWWKFDIAGDGYDYSENGNSASFEQKEHFDDISNFVNGLPSESDQGVAVDSNYIYVIGSYYPTQGNWNCTVLRYNLSDFSYVDAHDTLCYEEPTQTFSDGAIINEKLYVTQRHHGVSNICSDNKVSVYSVSDFSLLEHHDMPSGSPYCLEGIDGHDGYFWLMYGCGGNGCNAKVEKYNSNWNLVDTFYLGNVPGFGYQGIAWIGEQIYVNRHGVPDGIVAVAIYDWNGTTFTYNRTVSPPPVCNQGLAYYNNTIYWASRRPAPQNGRVFLTETTTHFEYSPNFVTGKYKNGINCNGVAEYASVPNFKPSFSGDFTINLWVNFNAYNSYQCPVTTMDNNSANSGFWLEFGSTRGFTMYNTGVELILEDNIQDLSDLNTGQWYFITVVREGSGMNNLKLYVDNVLAGQNTFTGTVGDPAQSLLIGTLSHAATSYYLDGMVDEVQFYDRALVADERTAHFETRKYASPEPTWGTWGNEEGEPIPEGDVLKKGFFYAKLGTSVLHGVKEPNFRIGHEINKIPSFEFEIANCPENHAAIAANITSKIKIYWQYSDPDKKIFTGVINADGIEYVSLTKIRITGFASYVELGWPFFRHLNSEDVGPIHKVLFGHSFINYTVEANNDTINDIPLDFDTQWISLFMGDLQPFYGLEIKYSTKGVTGNAKGVHWRYSSPEGWKALDVIDESRGFTKEPGTYNLIISHPPSDWIRSSVGGRTAYWIACTPYEAYSTDPKLDKIQIVNNDVHRVYYFDTSARAILLDVLANTGYTMDGTDQCPTDLINIVADYESPLRIIAAITNALTWSDDIIKKPYQWWIDNDKKVHMKQQRGTVHPEDITGNTTIFNNQVDYFHLANRIHGLGGRDGISQMRAIVEDIDSQDEHQLREIVVSRENAQKYITLKEELEKDIGYAKAPLSRIKGSVRTEFWLNNEYEVGDYVTLHQDNWDVDNASYQIVKADIGPSETSLDLGISREHLDGLKADLQRRIDLTNVVMHGSVNLIEFGPETMNYQRVDATEVYPTRLELEVPSETKKIHKVVVGWTLGNYRADVAPTAGGGATHAHGGYGGAGGGFTPEVEEGGGFTPSMLGKKHGHNVETSIVMTYHYVQCKLLNYTNGHVVNGAQHKHGKGTTGGPDDTVAVVDGLTYGCECSLPCGGGNCVTGVETHTVADQAHFHTNTGLDTDNATPAITLNAFNATPLTDIDAYAFSVMSDDDNPILFPTGHIHTGEEELDHPHAGILEAAHADHVIEVDVADPIDLLFDIHEIAGGTVMELIVNGEKVGEYATAQNEIRIDGYLNTGSNTIELQPIVTEIDKKGGATIKSTAILFYEPRKF